MRMTLNYVSASHDLLRTSQMPLAVIIQPLAIPEAGDDQLQVCSRVCGRQDNLTALLMHASSCGVHAPSPCPQLAITLSGAGMPTPVSVSMRS